MAIRKRNIPYYFLVNEDEDKLIKQKIEISKLSKSTYLRQMATNGYIVKEDLETIRNMTQEINKIGVNINQIAKHVNEVGAVQEDEYKYLKGKMNDIWQLLRSTLSKTL